jgi:hypothetical protein
MVGNSSDFASELSQVTVFVDTVGVEAADVRKLLQTSDYTYRDQSEIDLTRVTPRA